MPKKRKPYLKAVIKVDGKWYGRLRVRQPDGSLKAIYSAQQRNKTEARAAADALERKICGEGIEVLEAETLTFAQLAERYLQVRVVPAVYAGERKVTGLKHPEEAARTIRRVVRYFGQRQVQQITYSDLELYKSHLLAAPRRNAAPEGQVTTPGTRQ